MNRTFGKTLLGASLATLALAGAAHAQSASSGIRGEAEPNAQVVARNVDTGYTLSDIAEPDGDYAILGLQPGTYEVTSGAATRTVRVVVGETATIDLLSSEDELVIVGARITQDVTTSEVATVVTQEQIENLPQFNRNFINFAALAPGVRVSQEEREVTFQAGGQNPLAINVFIDGQSQKAQIIDGGISGQDDSRGNPFPQLAVQEFRVVTQNFSAEYDQSSSAIITAVTRSGSNEFHGEIFGVYQDPGWVEFHNLQGFNPQQPPEAERQQYGIALSGPIIRDRLHFFFTYEGKQEDRSRSVTPLRAGFEDVIGDVEDVVLTPFEEDLYFGKLTFQPAPDHRFDLSVTYREEQDIRDVGDQDAAERANALNVEETKANLRYQWRGSNWVNVAQADYLESIYNPTALNFTEFGREYIVFRDASAATPGFQFDINSRDVSIIRTGGRDSNQDIRQESTTLRNDLTFEGLGDGAHTLQIGGRVTFNTYFVEKEFQRNPFFLFDVEGRPEINGDPTIPVRVTIGSAVAPADVENTVYGFYIQDNWRLTDNFELNLGLRWDYEENAYNNDYTTPDNIVALLNAYENLPGYDLPFNSADYISDGDRDAFTDAWQPRLGFSWDVNGDESTVIFGGAGRYYDRVPYNFAFDERFKPTQFVREIFFSADGRPGTVLWDPAYLTPEGLQPLLDAQPNAGEIFLIQNGAEPPVTDQFNVGVRQRFGEFLASLTLSHAHTRNGFGWNIGNLGTGPDPRFNGPTPASLGFTEFRNLVFISTHEQERWYDALYLTLDRPFTEASGWGMSLAYTLSKAEQNGSRDANTSPFDFDYPFIELTPTYPATSDETHRIVASGIWALPWDMRVSALLTLGSGTPFTVFGPNPPDWNGGQLSGGDFLFFDDLFPFQNLDLRLQKSLEIVEGQEAFVYVDVLNATDRENTTRVEQFNGSPIFGQPLPQTVQGRSFQVGFGYRW